MRTLAASFVFIGLLIALGFYSIKTVPVEIQQAIMADIEHQYQQNELDGLEVTVNGRDVTLLGKAASQDQLNQAIQIASHRPGVRVVMIEASVDEGTRAFVAPMPDAFEDLPEKDLETE